MREVGAPLNNQQKIILREFLKKHDRLNSGLFTPNFTKLDARRQWEELTLILNNVANGAKKQWFQWRKTWRDQKIITKRKMDQMKRKKDNPEASALPTVSLHNDLDIGETIILTCEGDLIQEIKTPQSPISLANTPPLSNKEQQGNEEDEKILQEYYREKLRLLKVRLGNRRDYENRKLELLQEKNKNDKDILCSLQQIVRILTKNEPK